MPRRKAQPRGKDEAGYQRFQKSVSKRIRELRRVADLTQEEVAARVGFDYRYWQKIESGHLNLSLRTLYRVARALEVDVADLFTEPGFPLGRSPRG